MYDGQDIKGFSHNEEGLFLLPEKLSNIRKIKCLTISFICKKSNLWYNYISEKGNRSQFNSAERHMLICLSMLIFDNNSYIKRRPAPKESAGNKSMNNNSYTVHKNERHFDPELLSALSAAANVDDIEPLYEKYGTSTVMNAMFSILSTLKQYILEEILFPTDMNSYDF